MAALSTAALTVVIGVSVFVVGQAVQRFVLEPLQDQRKTIGEVAYALLMYGNIAHIAERRAADLPLLELADPVDVARIVRALGARLQQSLYVIPAYSLFARLRLVLPQPAVLAAIGGLTAWSNSIHSGDARRAQDTVAAALRIVRPA